MSTYLRKCIDIAPTGVITPGAVNDYRNLRAQPWWPALRATTSHIRITADWPSVQPLRDQPLGVGVTDRGTNSADSLAALDGQIKAATDDGMQVVLFPYRCPLWASGSEGIVSGSAQDSALFPEDRVQTVDMYRDWLAGRRSRPGYKDLHYRLPTDGFGPDSAWGRYVAALWDRYVAQAPAHGRVAVFETVNEPNLQLWPQRSAIASDDVFARFSADGTSPTVAGAVADMMVTVDLLARAHDAGVTCVAPSTSDADTETQPRYQTVAHRSPATTTSLTFAEPLLQELRSRGFGGGGHWVWSYHNYLDVESAEPTPGDTARSDFKSRVTYLRQALSAGGWNGRSLDGGPELYCTEGGCRLQAVRTRFNVAIAETQKMRDYQALVLTESLSRHHYAKGVGEGVGMITQYLTYTDTTFNSGLLEAAASGGAPRPALAAWNAVPEYLPPVAPRADWAPQL